MHSRKDRHTPAAQAGFSMVEMLITAFVLAVGILGLTMLLTMSLKASRGSRSMSSAILVAERVMDQVEMEGRLSWLNITNTDRTTPAIATDLPNLRYLTAGTLAPSSLVETFNSKGGTVLTAGTGVDPVDSTPFFTVTTTRAVANAAATGRMSDVIVRVQFVDSVDRVNAPIQRTLSLTRRIVHG